jgi:ferredoxin-NADP reductase
VLTTSATLFLALAFLLLGAINVWLVLEANTRVKAARASSRMLALHRIGGYLFIALFCAMSYFMVARLQNTTAENSPAVTLHLALALILSPLMFVKVLIARYYKSHYTMLMPLGLTIFVLAFVLIAGMAGPRLIRTSHVQQVRLDPTTAPVLIDLPQASALMQKRCGKCHNLDRIYKTVQSRDEWRTTVMRMVDYATGSPGEFQPGEADRIIDYLSATQSPAAPSNTPRPAEPSHRSRNTIAFLSFISLAAAALIVRRPATQVPAPQAQPATPPPATGPLLLQLIRITPQTSDSKTLRFSVQGRYLDARPGQFLTLTFLFDGKRETRCYSISSSPARSRYVEITPKRVPNGCVSVFLNDRASIGLTVEATGPFGQFCLDPAAHRKIVLLAAGSGITPMMSMLRYIDDLCLDTQATLLYCVRTADDIIFRADLDALQSRLSNFRYHVLLSQSQGRITADFISQAAPQLADRDFFLCGPPPFMESVREILTTLAVPADRIRQETFGTPPLTPPSTATFTVEFTRSGKTAIVPPGQTLLQAAAATGVAIPSACRQGQCGTCKTQMLEGHVRMLSEHALPGYILPCVSHPESHIKLDA